MLNKKVSVYNLESPRTSKPVANQFVITTSEGRYFQSYSSVIVFIPYGHSDKKDLRIVLDPLYWDYSTTTGKYRNIFLGESRKETEKKIKNGTYILRSLN